MATAQFLHEAPLWLILLPLLAAMGLARELGAWVHRRLAPEAERETADEGYIVSAVLGLLALLVAFSFGMALSRHEDRRELVVTEANALGTAYLRTSVLDEPDRLRDLMRRYAEERLAYGMTNGQAQRAAEGRAAALQPMVWAEAVRQVGAKRETALAAFVLAPINEAFDAAGARKAALEARLPASVLITLMLYFVAAAAVLGYAVAGVGSGGHRAASLALFALFALAFGVILDLDRPRSGLIRVPQGAMAEAVRLAGG